MNPHTLEGKTALVTGSTSGIGLGVAHALAAQGCHLVVNGLGAWQDAVDALKLHGRRVEYHGADLSRPTEIAEMMSFAASHFGTVDILVNNAGIQHVANVEDFDPARWDAVIAINLSAVFHCTRLVLPGMKQRNWGRIVNIASVHGLVASAQKAAYVAAKHGVVGLTKVTALETARTGVTCNAICPGWVLTPLVQAQIDARAKAHNVGADVAKTTLLSEKQPSAEFVTTEQIGELTLFLCSPAADQVRGAAWNIDGGWFAQ